MSQSPADLPERDPETLELFIEETVEGLQRMEKLLMDAEAGHPSPQILNTLFRDFHTIKGTSGFLALNRLLGLAHVAEDLLALLRDKGAPPVRHQLAVLVQVVDALRTLIGIVKNTGDDVVAVVAQYLFLGTNVRARE